MLGSRRASNSPSTQVNKNNVSDPTEVRVSLINNAELGDMSDDSDEQRADHNHDYASDQGSWGEWGDRVSAAEPGVVPQTGRTLKEPGG